jgi:ABC-type multidrug transport system fused ATPase/permease subunit
MCGFQLYQLIRAVRCSWPLDNMGDTLVDSVQAKMQLGLRNAVMTSLLQQDREYFDHHASAVLQERLNKDTEDLSRTIIQQPKNLISATVRVLSKSMFLYAHSPPLFWLGISVPVPFCVLMNTIGWRLVRKSDRKISKVNDQAAGSTAEILREISTVRQFGMESEEGKRYRIVADWREQLEFSMLTLKRFVYFIMWMSFVFSRILNTYVGINYVTRGLLDAAKLLLCVYQFDGITWGVRQIVDLVPEVARLMQPLTRIATLLNSVPKIEPHPENPGKRLKPDKFIGCIEFQDVDFTYPSERQKQVLFGLSFVVEPRTKVAFVGKAGCGKSTSVTLVQRFYDSAKGSITVDGLPISDYDVHHLRRHIGVVAQDNVLFSTSIRENIIYGMGQGHLPAPTDEMVWAACDAANVTEFVRTFPNGLETFIGEKGVKLSGGQKQRLAIARAIIRTPTILLLDEATSALDSVNEKEVQRALDAMLQKHEGVAIVIAHRLTTIKNCNKIIVMEKGRKVEEGTHAELMAVDVTVGTSDDEGVLPILTGRECRHAPVKSDLHVAPTCVTSTKSIAFFSPRISHCAGFAADYHKMWDTQMGEETFADVGLMSDEQLQLKLKYLEEESQRLGAEASKRGVRMPTASLDGDAS